MTRLFSALINGGLLSSLLALVVWSVLRFVPRRLWNAATRYALWWAVLGITIALPALYLQRPPQARDPGMGTVQTSSRRPAVSLSGLATTPTLPAPADSMPSHPVWRIEVPADTWLRWLFAGWAALSGLLLLRLVLSSVALHRTSTRSFDIPTTLPSTGARGVRVAASVDIAGPVAIGPFRPSILIPAALLDRLEATELEQIVAHEAAHLERYDDLALLTQRIIEALFVFHPVVRWITRRIDLEREIACDDLVIAATGRPRSYATCLTRVVEFGGHSRPSLVAAGVAHDVSHLSRRVDMLLDKTRHTGTKLLKTRLGAVVAALAALAWIGGREGGFVAFAAPLVRTMRAVPRLIPLPGLAARAAEVPQDAVSPEFQGRVIDDATGDALRSAEVRFRRAGILELAADLDSDREGCIRTAGLPAGDYTVEVSKPNYITASMQFKIPGDPLMVRLVHYGAISGRVADQQGKPVPGTIHAPGGRAIGGARVVVLAKTEGGQLRSVRETSLQDDGTIASTI
jgi:beta-lactamase regulating signal transducer with metallopeptidase domain